MGQTTGEEQHLCIMNLRLELPSLQSWLHHELARYGSDAKGNANSMHTLSGVFVSRYNKIIRKSRLHSLISEGKKIENKN